MESQRPNFIRQLLTRTDGCDGNMNPRVCRNDGDARDPTIAAESLDRAQNRSEIPWSIRHNAGISMDLVGPVGLEPTTKGFTVP